ncbi:rare lipoprotein A [Fluviicoccus keumensis]|uniref:Endolytic peptidoglycan transglycosylase RlpA n=2 Tax=Fluviicoccus keumensis TaxID=1435465 RepID=A0A4Q7YKL0_9GAMM|nr:septal ring lytic transglycosylase RlpA family protein [Fluviicoccus keumensis]RZU37039.1 rare lipoprotein A [Fluviicoccus keumensis]
MTYQNPLIRAGVGLLVGAALVACSHTPPRAAGNAAGSPAKIAKGDYVVNEDGPPAYRLSEKELAMLQDAVPVDEPMSRYGNTSPYTVLGETYHVMASAQNFRQSGRASWYGKKFHGQRTSSGERYDMYSMTAAHKNLPIPCYVRVTNKDNGKSVIVKVNDRGPFHSDRIMDVSFAAAAKLGMLDNGTANVSIETINPAKVLKEQTIIAKAEKPAEMKFFVQAGAFGNRDNATALQARLLELASLPVNIQTSDDPMPVHRVQIGPFDDEATAEKTTRLLREAAVGSPIIVKR